MSLTNMSLLPLELLSSGCIPVVTDGENNRLVSNNEYIAYCQSDPLSLAKELSRVITQKNLAIYAKAASESVANESWDQSGKHVVNTVVKSINSDGGH